MTIKRDKFNYKRFFSNKAKAEFVHNLNSTVSDESHESSNSISAKFNDQYQIS